MIDVTNVDKVKLVKKVFDLSVPQGLGFLQASAGSMSDEDAKRFIHEDGTINMDYVQGRACKFNVINDGVNLVIRDTWYDHTNAQFEELLKHVGIIIETKSTVEHGCACNCVDCQK